MEGANTKIPKMLPISYADAVRRPAGPLPAGKGVEKGAAVNPLGNFVDGLPMINPPDGDSPHQRGSILPVQLEVEWDVMPSKSIGEASTPKKGRGSAGIQGQNTVPYFKESHKGSISSNTSPQPKEQSLLGYSPETPSSSTPGSPAPDAVGGRAVKNLPNSRSWASVATFSPSETMDSNNKGKDKVTSSDSGDTNRQDPGSPSTMSGSEIEDTGAPEQTLPVVNEEQVITDAVDKEERKVERQRLAMLRTLAKGDAILWEFQIGWDVLVKCEGMTWKLHRNILCRESRWFARRLGSREAEGPVELDCYGHQREQLAHALEFMYHKSYSDAYLPADNPLNGLCIHKNAFMFICGASVNCRSMMQFAIDALNDIADVADSIIPTHYRCDLSRFHEPLRAALVMVFDQGDRPILGILRLTLARIVDISLMYFVLNPGFRAPFMALWCPYIYFNCVRDNDSFTRRGWLEPRFEGKLRRFEEARRMIMQGFYGFYGFVYDISEGNMEPDISPQQWYWVRRA